AECPIGFADVVVEIGVAAIQGDRLADQLDREVAAPGLMGNEAEKVQAVDVPWVDLEDAAVDGSSFFQPTGAVQGHGLVQRSFAIRHHRPPMDAGPPRTHDYAVMKLTADEVRQR